MFSRSCGSVAVAATLILAAAVASLVAAPGMVYGQAAEGVDERLLACSAIADTAERAACFDAVVKNMREGVESPAADVATPEADPDGPAASSPAGAATGGKAAADTPVMQIEEQAAAVTEEAFAEFNATILKSSKSGLYHFVVELDNGQVWEETDGSRRPSLPKVGQDVRVYEGRFGGYRMKIGNDNRISWVRRLR